MMMSFFIAFAVLLIGLFCLLFPQKSWEFFYLGLKPYNKGILKRKWSLISRLAGVIFIALSMLRFEAIL